MLIICYLYTHIMSDMLMEQAVTPVLGGECKTQKTALSHARAVLDLN